jgi:hypothetical protein
MDGGRFTRRITIAAWISLSRPSTRANRFRMELPFAAHMTAAIAGYWIMVFPRFSPGGHFSRLYRFVHSIFMNARRLRRQCAQGEIAFPHNGFGDSDAHSTKAIRTGITPLQ